ncbi:hypothetical protein [Helicobacter canis]|uniref:Uncharacterized protein n=2 Tax=Helicobacter canis TaxID=29419 RepID=V8CKK0_9HELI|nr:hypothetical protein [Helicobacter canis]ETD27908.1 hypothetical protein HMPREF2087_00832 [Helicobacter canis NCTC 12740]KAA8709836.1 hypothetical protein F4V45_04160 [Helicobacter canis]
MAISPIGNITYINQNMQATSATHANAMQRGDMIPQEFEDKLKEIQEVRPTETGNKIDKDTKGNGQWEEGEQEEREPSEQEESNPLDSSLNSDESAHLLNIKV